MSKRATKTKAKKPLEIPIAPKVTAAISVDLASKVSPHEGWSAVDDGLARECETLSHQKIH